MIELQFQGHCTIFTVTDIEELPIVIKRLDDLQIDYLPVKKRCDDYPSLMKYVNMALKLNK